MFAFADVSKTAEIHERFYLRNYPAIQYTVCVCVCVCVCVGVVPGAAADHWGRMAGPVWRDIRRSKEVQVRERSAREDHHRRVG